MRLEREFLLNSIGVEPQPALPLEEDAPNPLLINPSVSTIAITMQQLIDDLPEQMALLDENCTILAVNEAWKTAVLQHGFAQIAPGANYREICRSKAAEGSKAAAEA